MTATAAYAASTAACLRTVAPSARCTRTLRTALQDEPIEASRSRAVPERAEVEDGAVETQAQGLREAAGELRHDLGCEGRLLDQAVGTVAEIRPVHERAVRGERLRANLVVRVLGDRGVRDRRCGANGAVRVAQA